VGGDLTDLLDAAEAALAGVVAHPAEAAAAARAVLSTRPRSHAAASVAHRALALAALEQGEVNGALRSARAAVRAAVQAGSPDRLAQAVCTEAGVLLLAGNRSRAMVRIAEAVAVAGPAVRPDVLAQQATLLLRTGRHREAVRVAREALAEGGDPPDPDVLVTLGGALLELGDLGPADDAFAAAATAYRGAGARYAAAMCEHNRGVLAVRQGRVPDALATFAAAAAELEAMGLPPVYVLSGEVAALLEAGLADEALASAQRAVASAGRAELSLRAGVLLLAARSALAAGDGAAAAASARAAAGAYHRLGDAGGRASCRALAVVAQPAPSRSAAARQVHLLTGLGAELARRGRVADAVGIHGHAVRRGLDAGLPPASVDASVSAVRRLRPRTTGLARAASHEAEARFRFAGGDLRGARRSAAAGLDVVDTFRAGWGGTELRAQASRHGSGLADIALGTALVRGQPDEVLCWAERWRAAGVRHPPVPSPATADLLAALRRARADAEAAMAAGDRPEQALRDVVQLETTLRRVARQVATEQPWASATASRDQPARQVRASLGDRALVEVVEHAGNLHAVVLGHGRTTLHHLGPVGPALAEVDALGFALRRLGRAGASAATVAGARRAAAASLDRLAGQLVRPLQARLGDRPVVVVPTADLHAVPWPALPGLDDRPVAVAPSSLWWAAAVREPVSAAGPALVAAGPGLPGAHEEVRRLAPVVPGAVVLAGPAATPEAVTTALADARLAHLACHGHFRADNPMCSALELAGGRLTVYDLETLGRTPPLVVLSACDSGVPATRPGDELLGLAAALVALGSRAVVASVVAVPDLDAAPLMLAFHEAVAAGTSPAAALARAVSCLDPASPTAFATRCAFVCFGAG
jgi:tetratricopeptide (TPR) repeat protein